jgi:putative transposase
MKTVISARLKLHTDPAQFVALPATQLAYRDALNYVSRYAFAHGKMSNRVALQGGTYDEVRARFHLPSQMACSVPRQVGATYKALWTKVKQNAVHRNDYSFKTDSHVSILSLDGRVIMPYTGYHQHVALIQYGASIGAAELWYDKPRKQFYLLIPLEIEVADPTPETHIGGEGVDVGVRYLAVTATTKGDRSFQNGKKVVPKANHYARLRKRLQKKGTRPASRRLVVINGRERRLKQDANHVFSKRTVDRYPQTLIGLEQSTDIRDRTHRKHGKKATRKQRKANAAYSKWAFAEMHGMIAYKALLHGSMVIKVDAHYTSQACPMCRHNCDANRPHHGLMFVCQYTLHADLVGARNITMRTLLARQDWARTGSWSMIPPMCRTLKPKQHA